MFTNIRSQSHAVWPRPPLCIFSYNPSSASWKFRGKDSSLLKNHLITVPLKVLHMQYIFTVLRYNKNSRCNHNGCTNYTRCKVFASEIAPPGQVTQSLSLWNFKVFLRSFSSYCPRSSIPSARLFRTRQDRSDH